MGVVREADGVTRRERDAEVARGFVEDFAGGGEGDELGVRDDLGIPGLATENGAAAAAVSRHSSGRQFAGVGDIARSQAAHLCPVQGHQGDGGAVRSRQIPPRRRRRGEGERADGEQHEGMHLRLAAQRRLLTS